MVVSTHIPLYIGQIQQGMTRPKDAIMKIEIIYKLLEITIFDHFHQILIYDVILAPK